MCLPRHSPPTIRTSFATAMLLDPEAETERLFFCILDSYSCAAENLQAFQAKA
jgi:hypothetical protein